MYRLAFVFICSTLLACNNKKTATKEKEGLQVETFSNQFSLVKVPYQLTDAGLQKNADTALIRSPEFIHFIPDSITNKIFGKGSKIKYYPLVKIKDPKGESYYLVKAIYNNKNAALLLSFDKTGQYASTLPFLVEDGDAGTVQNSFIDKSYTISRSVIRKKNNEIIAEGKDVFVFNREAGKFTLIMTDMLDESRGELNNPIDTFARRHKYAGDYIRGKRNIISIRDGRTPGQAIAFVHLENKEDECIAELKGELLFTSPNTAVYRQGGDPCVLQFIFTSSSVMLKEEEGCGNHRGLNCLFEGTFPKKKAAKPKPSVKKKTKK